MSTGIPASPVGRIGEVAGVVWQHLHSNGPVSLTGLAQRLKIPRDLVMQAVGWLAREGKVEIIEAGRTKRIALKAD